LNKPTHKECLIKGVDPLDGEYIDWKLDENITTMKKDIKEEILKEVKMEMNKKFEELKKEYNAKFDISFSDEDTMKIKDNIHSYTTTRLFNKILWYLFTAIPLHGYSTKFFDMKSYYSNLCYYSKWTAQLISTVPATLVTLL
jgi:hypothetical protein